MELVIGDNGLYYPIPKVGCTTLKLGFLHKGKMPRSHAELKELDVHSWRSEPEADREYLKIIFVRNPFDRLVSCWQSKVVKEKGKLFKRYGVTSKTPFKEFVNIVATTPDDLSEPHFRAQHTFELQRADYIGRFENFNAHYIEVCQRVNLHPKKLPNLNASGHRAWMSYYDDETYKLVEQRYRDDFRRYRYPR